MTHTESAHYYGNLSRVAIRFAISHDDDTETLAAYIYAVHAARFARAAAPALCSICRARTSTPATLADGSVVCQMCGENAAIALRALASTFGAEWDALTDSDRALIVRDCTVDGGVDDFTEYRRSIGPGNLAAYALTQRARFRRVDAMRAD